MRGNTVNLLIGGEAGQGLATINDIICKTLTRHGYYIAVTQEYMSRVRGGHNAFYIRISPEHEVAHEETVDILVALNKESVDLHQNELSDNALIIADKELGIEKKGSVQVPFGDLTEKRYHNVAGLGVLGAFLGLDIEILINATRDYFKGKSEDILKKNEETLRDTMAWANENADLSSINLKKPENVGNRLTLHGNQAIALGAISAGIKFYSFYPMTPSTSIGVTLASFMDKYPIVVEQAEDEIAAINMAIGASFAGAPSMVGTSGGGFALMNEGVSLAAVTETPLVIVVAQRPGPATGMATRTEQADLDFVLHSGHGEFPRAIFAPGNSEQCFDLTRQAFELAESTQSPIFLLTDQYLSDCYQSVGPLNMDSTKTVTVGADPETVSVPYRRYELTDSGVSPRLLPGRSEHLVAADSHEHSEDGHITEDIEVRNRMLEKRLRKMDLIKQQVIKPEYSGPEKPDVLLVCWGSTRAAVFEAAAMLDENGKKAAALHFQQVWPLIPENFIHYLENAGEVISVEGNALGQFAGIIRRETGLKVSGTILKYDGRIITPEYILRKLNENQTRS